MLSKPTFQDDQKHTTYSWHSYRALGARLPSALQQQWGVPGLSPVLHFLANNNCKKLRHAVKLLEDRLQANDLGRWTANPGQGIVSLRPSHCATLYLCNIIFDCELKLQYWDHQWLEAFSLREERVYLVVNISIINSIGSLQRNHIFPLEISGHL